MKDDHQETDELVRASLETLVRDLAEDSRREIAALRTALDKGLSSLESRLSARDHERVIQSTAKGIARISSERLDREREQADTTLAQALAANTRLRTTLAEVRGQIEGAQAQATAAEADRKTAVAERDKTHAQLVDANVQLKRLQQVREELTAERADLQRRLGEVTTARELAEAQHAQLANVSQKLTDALSKTLHQVREELHPVADVPEAPPKESAPASKRVLRFSEKARDAKRIAMRQGTHISVENIPGELVDLSVGGAQVLLRQSVKPNQLVRLHLPNGSVELLAKARVVWVILEHRETSLSVYRTGLKFTDVDVPAIERFMGDFCKTPLAQSGT